MGLGFGGWEGRVRDFEGGWGLFLSFLSLGNWGVRSGVGVGDGDREWMRSLVDLGAERRGGEM